MPESRADRLISEILQVHPKGFDLSLGRIAHLLEKLGNPQHLLPPIIHIAGTNGKGSTSAFSRTLLEKAGYSVHTHTSPHLVRWHERFRLGGKGGSHLVSDDVLAGALTQVMSKNGDDKITLFEVLTATALVLFAEYPADAVILEVGLGGRFDATNVIKNPAVSVITPVSMDHEAFLGDTIEKIAFEKAGIIKPKRPLVIGYQEEDGAQNVLIQRAEAVGSPYRLYGRDFQAFEQHGRMVFQDNTQLLDLPLPKLKGHHQLTNAATAISAVRQAGFELSVSQISDAVAETFWPARLQPITSGTIHSLAPAGAEILLDGGHNPAAGQALRAEMRALSMRAPRPLYIITGMINTKNSAGFLVHFKDLAVEVITVPITSTDAAVPAAELAEVAKSVGLSARALPDFKCAMQHIFNKERLPRILICGSLYLAGEFLKANHTIPQ